MHRGLDQRLSYYWEIRGSVLLSIGESIAVNLDNVCLNNPLYYSLDVIEFQSELYVAQSPFTDTIGMNEKWHKLNPTCRKKSVTSLIKLIFFLVYTLKIVQSKCTVKCKTC